MTNGGLLSRLLRTGREKIGSRQECIDDNFVILERRCGNNSYPPHAELHRALALFSYLSSTRHLVITHSGGGCLTNCKITSAQNTEARTAV